MLLADSCFNINHESFKNDLGDILDAANNVGVEYFFCPASKEKEIEDLINLSESYQKNIFCSVGIHPHYASDLKPNTIENLQKYLGNQHVKAIGEIGLDYYRNFQSPETATTSPVRLPASGDRNRRAVHASRNASHLI